MGAEWMGERNLREESKWARRCGVIFGEGGGATAKKPNGAFSPIQHLTFAIFLHVVNEGRGAAAVRASENGGLPLFSWSFTPVAIKRAQQFVGAACPRCWALGAGQLWRRGGGGGGSLPFLRGHCETQK